MDGIARQVYRGVAAFRKELDNPEYLTGDRFENVKEHWDATIRRVAPSVADVLASPNVGPVHQSLDYNSSRRLSNLRNNIGATRTFIEFDRENGRNWTPEKTRREVDIMKALADEFLSTDPMKNIRPNARALNTMKGLSKGGLPLPPELNREVVGFLSPAGESEELEKALSRTSQFYPGKPGVYAPPPGGYGPGAAGGPGGPPAGGKRRKTRKGKGKSRKARYSRRR